MVALSVVMPAYDEIANLRVLIPAIWEAVGAEALSEVQIVTVVRRQTSPSDDAELRALGAVVVHRAPSDSFGDAMRSGIAAVSASSDLVLTMDADGSHDPRRIPAMVARAATADVVVASRYVEGGRSDNGLALRLMSRALNRAYSLVLGIDCRDVSTNFKLFHRHDLVDLTLTCEAFDVVEELLFQVARRHGSAFRVVEVPDHFRERLSGVSQRRLGPFIAAYLVTLARLRRQAGRPGSS